MPYLAKKDAKKYPLDPDGDSAGPASLPPRSSAGANARSRNGSTSSCSIRPGFACWHPAHAEVQHERRAGLAHYFAAVTRQTNPGIGLTFPLEAIPQRDDIDREGGYWQNKTKEYVARLKKSKALDMDGKEIKGKGGKALTAYEQRMEEYKPLWKTMVEEEKKSIQSELKKLVDLTATRNKELEAKQKLLKDDKAKAAEIQKDIDSLKAALKDGEEEKSKLDTAFNSVSVDKLSENWEEKEAYAADSYRLLTSRKLCAQCHQIGNIAPSEKDKQGPPLALANQRLRPGWVENWVNKPQRFVPYASLMPTYFSDQEFKWQPLHAGVASEQLQAVRDVLMNFPRVAEMPVNRLYNPDQPADKK